MSLYTHILFSCSLIYLVIGVIILLNDSSASLNRVFFAFNLSLFIWSFSSAAITVSPDKAVCEVWNIIAAFGFCTFSSISVHFFLIYAKKVELLRKWITYIVLYLPAAILLSQITRQNEFASDFIYNQYGWVAITNLKSVWFWILMFSITLSGVINIYLCGVVYRKAISTREHKQSRVMLLSALISFMFGMGLVTFTVILRKQETPDISSTVFIIWLLGILYAIKKYRLMTLSPSLAAETVLKTIVDPVILVNPDGLITYINPTTLSVLDYDSTDLLDHPYMKLFPDDTAPAMERMMGSLEKSPIQNLDTFFVSKNHTKIPILLSASVCSDNSGDKLGFVAAARDITKYKQREEEIRFLSYHDQLTGLYNRRFYEDEILRLNKKDNFPLAIIMGDVNGLKIVNDSIGHAKGDELLIKVAQAITESCRPGDVAARLGGDEFVVLLPKTGNEQAEQMIEQINGILLNEKVDKLDISISFGYQIKTNEQENIQDVIKDAEDQMYLYKRSNRKSTMKNTIDLIMNALYERNHREMLHSKRVSKLCEAIALQMNFSKKNVYSLKIAGLMHDIGKIGIDDKILNKPDALNDDEWLEMKKHPEIGQRILSDAFEFSEISEYIVEHQEKWDGTGYPKGLKGEEIKLQARIIAVADAYDAMTNQRSYGKKLSMKEAIDEIQRCAGTQFDPAIVKVFVEKVLEGKQDEVE